MKYKKVIQDYLQLCLGKAGSGYAKVEQHNRWEIVIAHNMEYPKVPPPLEAALQRQQADPH